MAYLSGERTLGWWFLGLSGIVETTDGDLWLNGLNGIFHISRTTIAEALRNPSYRIEESTLEIGRGCQALLPNSGRCQPLSKGVMGDGGFLSHPVWCGSIQPMHGDDKAYGVTSSLTFPARTSSVTIRYSAISLSDPEAR